MSITYQFEECGAASCSDIAAGQTVRLIGCRAVNTSFDSERIARPDWDHVNGFAITPVITPDFVTEWPVSHIAYCDEWWIFDGEIPANFEVSAFCNHMGMRIADYRELDFEGGCTLESWLARFMPRMVFGNGESGYLISRMDGRSGG